MMLTAESNKYLVRHTKESDFDKIKELVKGSEHYDFRMSLWYEWY